MRVRKLSEILKKKKKNLPTNFVGGFLFSGTQSSLTIVVDISSKIIKLELHRIVFIVSIWLPYLLAWRFFCENKQRLMKLIELFVFLFDMRIERNIIMESN